MNKGQSVLLLFFTICLTVLLAFSCTQPSSPQAEGDETTTTTIDFGHSDKGIISGTVDFSTMLNRDQIKGMVICCYETDSSNDLQQRLFSIVNSLSGYSAEYKLTGLKDGYRYNPQIYLYDTAFIMQSQNPLLLQLHTYDYANAVAGTDVPLNIKLYSSFDGQYEGADKVALSGNLDLSKLDMSLTHSFSISINGNDGDNSTNDPSFVFNGRVQGQTLVPYSFINLDPTYEWSIGGTTSDVGNNKRSFSSNPSGSHKIVTQTGTQPNITMIHTFDATLFDQYKDPAQAIISGNINLINLPDTVKYIFIKCSDDTPYSYGLDYDFNRKDVNSTVDYKFINLDPTEDHSISITLKTKDYNDYYTSPYEIQVTGIAEGETHTEDIILPATH